MDDFGQENSHPGRMGLTCDENHAIISTVLMDSRVHMEESAWTGHIYPEQMQSAGKKPAYESPIVVNLNGVSEGRGVDDCWTGSSASIQCADGAAAGSLCGLGEAT